MKRVLLPILMGFVVLLGMQQAQAFDPADLRRLKAAWKCPDCDLQGANLQGAYLPGADLWKANLQGAFLKNANLSQSYLEGANLQDSTLSFADLQSANLQDANLRGANLYKAELDSAHLQDANLEDANLQGANLQGANLQGANLREANLSSAGHIEANLQGANLQGANLTWAWLEGAKLTDADLRGANLTDADLRGANLQGANLQGAKLTDIDLRGANLRGARLDADSIKVARARGAINVPEAVVGERATETMVKKVKLRVKPKPPVAPAISKEIERWNAQKRERSALETELKVLKKKIELAAQEAARRKSVLAAQEATSKEIERWNAQKKGESSALDAQLIILKKQIEHLAQEAARRKSELAAQEAATTTQTPPPKPVIESTNKRIALVVGNSKYKARPLDNPVRDARLIGTTLKQYGFRVTLVEDADYRKFRKALASFRKELRTAGHETTALFYYSGHGMQYQGNNYLIPIGSEVETAIDLDIETIRAERIQSAMASITGVKIMLLDACRDSPFKSFVRSRGLGLAQMDAPKGTIIGYSTSPGKVAIDGTGKNSPYALGLVKAIRMPGLTIEAVLKKTLNWVDDTTSGKQVPWYSSSLRGDFYFSKK